MTVRYIAPGLTTEQGLPRTREQALYVAVHHWPMAGKCLICQEVLPSEQDRCAPYRAAEAMLAEANGQMRCQRCRGQFQSSPTDPDQSLCPVCRDQGSLFPEIEETP